MARALLLLGLCTLAPGCGGTQPVEIHFDAVAFSAPVRCGAAVLGLGTSQARYDLKDLRFYVHDLRLLAKDGTLHPLTLDDDGTWQSRELALLDFEDGKGDCVNGNPETRTVVTGTAAAGDYVGLRFVLGVPASQNHADASTAKAPLNLTSLFWSWNAGYKFLRLDGRTEGLSTGHNLHLGSGGCDGSPVSCARSNRPEIVLAGFDPAKDEVQLDVAALFGGSNLDANAEATPPGCMGSPTSDPDCLPLFERLGLEGGTQTAFTFAPRSR